MGTGFIAIVFLVLSALVVLAALSLIRGIHRTARLVAKDETFEPFVDFFPPEPVVRTPGMVVLGTTAVLWGAGHVGVGAAWSATGMLVPRVVEAWLIAGYLCIAATLTGVGGVLLLRSQAHGRTFVSWGQFLTVVLTFFGLAVTLMLPGVREIPREVRGAAWAIATGLGGYLAVTVAIGALAQHVGRADTDATAAGDGSGPAGAAPDSIPAGADR